jgi:hypothetical protein
MPKACGERAPSPPGGPRHQGCGVAKTRTCGVVERARCAGLEGVDLGTSRAAAAQLPGGLGHSQAASCTLRGAQPSASRV